MKIIAHFLLNGIIIFWNCVKKDLKNKIIRIGLLGSFLIFLGSYSPAFLPIDSDILKNGWVGEILTYPGMIFSTFFILCGMALMFRAWWLLKKQVEKESFPKTAWLIWSLPFLFCPPLFSNDAYSYVAQGLILSRGMDPYIVPPVAVPGAAADHVNPMWLFTPSPYGPLSLQLQHWIVEFCGRNYALASVAMRVPVIISMWGLYYLLPKIANRLKLNQNYVLWSGLFNPLMLFHLSGGAHNDAMMIVLVVASLHFALDGKFWLSCITITCAFAFKQNAIFGIIGVAGLLTQYKYAKNASFINYMKTCIRVGSVTMFIFILITLACGLSFGWINNFSDTVSIISLLAPSTWVGYIIGYPLSLNGVNLEVVRETVYNISFGLMGLVTLYLGFFKGRVSPLTASALAFGAFVLFSRVVHPWYILPFIVTFALTPHIIKYEKHIGLITLVVIFYSMVDAAYLNATYIAIPVIIIWTARLFKHEILCFLNNYSKVDELR